MKAVLPALHWRGELEVTWFASPGEPHAGMAEAEIGWVDMQPTAPVADAIRAGKPMRNVADLDAGY